MTKELLQQALDALTRLSFLGNGDFPGNSEGNRIAQKAVADIKQALAQQEPNPWADAVIDQLVVHHIYQSVHDTEPRKAIYDLLCMNQSIALDPQVSSDAQALIDRGRKEAQQEQPASVDAYVGAREDAAIWKKRALEAEELNRKFIADVNGPTYLGEPVKQEQPAQEPVAYLVPKLASFKDARSVHFSRVEGCTLTNDQLIEKMSGEVIWSAQIFSDGDGVIDKHGTHHAPKPLYTRPVPTQPAMSVIDIEQWEPCSPSWLNRGGDCGHAPRLWNSETQNHWHPKQTTQPALKDDVGVACLETMVKTMTNLGIATDDSLEGFGARLEHNIYAMCRAVDGIFKAQPALSDRGRREAQQEQPASVDAYVGAREDAAIWKKRALEAEELNRKFIADVNGPTYLGEPVKQEQPAQKPVAWVRRHPNGALTQEFLADGAIDPVRKTSGAWVPLGNLPPTQPALSDDDIEKVIAKGVKSGSISWTGFREDGEGKYTVPILSEHHCQIARAIAAHCRGGANG